MSSGRNGCFSWSALLVARNLPGDTGELGICQGASFYIQIMGMELHEFLPKRRGAFKQLSVIEYLIEHDHHDHHDPGTTTTRPGHRDDHHKRPPGEPTGTDHLLPGGTGRPSPYKPITEIVGYASSSPMESYRAHILQQLIVNPYKPQ